MALPEHRYIDTEASLKVLCDELRQRPYIAVDTEFLRERTYRPELCLVQVKHKDILACIDTIAIKDCQALNALLLDRGVLKVFHAASQDLEIFYLMTGQVPKPLFDTQVAAPLLGYQEQIGYGNLVKEHLGIELSKSQTRADWTRRPLPLKQIAYALDDVIHLESLYLSIEKKLRKLKRLDWLQAEFAIWENPERYEQPAGERWKKIRNVERYKGPALSIIQHLARWREIKARELNIPRNWLIKDDVLLSIAQQSPGEQAELQHIRGLDKKSADRFGKELLDIVRVAQTQKPQPMPEYQKKQKPEPGQLAQIQLLQSWVTHRAAELDIAAGLLAPQATLEKFVCGVGRQALSGWRDGLIGEELSALLLGSTGLRATKTGIELTTVDVS